VSQQNPCWINCVGVGEYVVPHWPPNFGAYENDWALEFLLRLPAPEPFRSLRLEKTLADIGHYFAVDIGTFGWYKAGIWGGVK
jgi:hypothetical protein